jgi:DNA invertase Pin-like site-specific DNA recombinase
VIAIGRVSTTDRDLTVQIEPLKVAGSDMIWKRQRRERTTTKGRTELGTILDFIRKGDRLVVTRIDRLPRPVANLQTEGQGRGVWSR